MPATCIITGYKVGLGVIVIYGFVLSGSIYESPSYGLFNQTFTFPFPTDPQDNLLSECGVPPPLGKGADDTPIARLLTAIVAKRILGGSDSLDGDWPWMVYLFQKTGRRKQFLCGGTLLNDRWVLTAAHCISEPNSPNVYGVVLGEHNVSRLTAHEREMDVEAIVRHKQFSGASFNNDLALLKLSETVRFTRYIRPVCLAPQDFPTDATESVDFDGEKITYAGKICTALGWGKTDKLEKSDVLQQVNVVVLPHILCTSATRGASKLYGDRPVNENDPKLCAGGAVGEDTCFGDSGGPLLCIYKSKYYLHGITSYGTSPCGQKNRPGVYVRAADYHDWIMSIIQ